VWQRTHSTTSWKLPLKDFRIGDSSILDDDYSVVIDVGKT